MERTRSSPTEEIPEVRAATIRPLIESFFERMTAEQWRILKLGTPDDATKMMLAELLLDLISLVSESLVSALKQDKSGNTVISEERVLSSLGETISQTLAQVLDVKDKVHCVSTERLTKLIVKEVAESVNSALSASKDTLESVMTPRVTPPHRLNTMVGHACKMVKAFMAKMKGLCTPQPRKERASPILTTPPPDRQEDQEDLEVADSEDHCQSPARSLEPEPAEQVSGGSEDSLLIETSKAVQEIISKEVHEITEPLLDDMTDSEFEWLQTASFQEIKVISDDIAQSIVEEINSLEESDETTATLTLEEKTKLALRGVRQKINNFFAKTFAKMHIHRIVAQLKAKFSTDSDVESRQSMPSLVASVDSLLTEDAEKKPGGYEVRLSRTLESISNGKVLVFSKVLSDFLYRHLMPEIVPEQITQRGRCRIVTVAPSRDAVYGEIKGKVWRFLALMGWWLSTQARTHSDRVTYAIKDTEALTPTPDIRGSVLDQDATQTERNKMSVRILLMKLLSRTMMKTKVNATFVKPEIVVQRLHEKILAEVEGADLYITPETFKNLDKAIFKDLSKKWGSAESVLVSLCLNEPVIENCVVAAFKRHLMTPPKKRSAIYRFFSSVGKAISQPFRRRAGAI